MQSTPRTPVANQPAEPGWWRAVDGLWYPPESFPAAPAPVATAPAAVAQGAVVPTAAAPVAIGPPLGMPGGAQWQGRGPVPALPVPTLGRPGMPAQPRTPPAHATGRGGDAMAIASVALGIVALTCTWYILAAFGSIIGLAVNLVLGVASLCFGISARRNSGSVVAIVGIVIGSVSCTISGLFVLMVIRWLLVFNRL